MSSLAALERQAVDLAHLRPLTMRDVEELPVEELPDGTGGRVLTRYTPDADIATLLGRQVDVGAWARILNSGDPTNATIQHGFGIAGLAAETLVESFASPLTLTATEQTAWPVANYTPIIPGVKSGTYFRFWCAAQITTTATASPTLTVTPRIGTSNVGTSLGATPSISLTASQTSCPCILHGELNIERGGRSGVATFVGELKAKLATPANGAYDTQHTFGWTQVTGQDFSAGASALALWIGLLSTITTTTVAIRQLLWAFRG